MSGETYRNIAPAPSRQQSESSTTRQGYFPADANRSNTAGRRKLAVACGACRQRKQKCDGQRPVCTPCRSRSTECQYETQPDETRYTAIKRRTDNLEKEAQDYREVLTNFRVRSEEEAQQLLQHLRTTKTFNIGAVLDVLRKGQ